MITAAHVNEVAEKLRTKADNVFIYMGLHYAATVHTTDGRMLHLQADALTDLLQKAIEEVERT